VAGAARVAAVSVIGTSVFSPKLRVCSWNIKTRHTELTELTEFTGKKVFSGVRSSVRR
jgi:hypothetical protein